jgi:hypothetical protein
MYSHNCFWLAKHCFLAGLTYDDVKHSKGVSYLLEILYSTKLKNNESTISYDKRMGNKLLSLGFRRGDIDLMKIGKYNFTDIKFRKIESGLH